MTLTAAFVLTRSHFPTATARFLTLATVLAALTGLVGLADGVALGDEGVRAEAPAESAHAEKVDFDRDIRPLLSNTCFYCHGPDAENRAADLRLDQEEDAKDWVIVEGEPEESELVSRIFEEDPDLVMPPPDQKQQLSNEQKELLKRWIAEGAVWTKHWSFVPPERAELPENELADWPKNEIDRFVLAKLEEQQLKPSPQAERETLIRRVSLDLTGLPPTLEEVEAFISDESPEAYELVVDRLLASPRYGEHMAQPWLAAARYADTNGFQNDATRTMWPWRDWVIKAMNDNKPFDEFTIEQLAGDLLEEPTTEQLVATGFHRNNALNGEGGRDQEESRTEYVIDRVDATSTVWLGLTMACCRCHDHKYDPISHNEFYEFAAYFNSIDESGGVDAGGNAKPVLPLPTPEQKAAMQKRHLVIKGIRDRIKQLPAPDPTELAAWEEETRVWLARDEAGTLWKPLESLELSVEGGADWEPLEDGSVLVRKVEDATDDYVITIDLPAGDHRGLRIEALRHPELTKGALSNGVKGGFSVTGLVVELDGEPIQLIKPEANVGGQAGADGLLDKNKYTTWRVFDPAKAPEVPTWLARFEKPIVVAAKGEGEARTLVVRMRHKTRTGDAPIGRFRLSLTDYPEPTVKDRLGMSPEVAAAIKEPAADRTDQQAEQVIGQYQEVDAKPLHEEIAAEQDAIRQIEKKQLFTMIMKEREYPRHTYRLERGIWNQPDKSRKLQPGVPAVLPELPEEAAKDRLTLARWLMRPDHPLTARVTVNRYWQHFFGVGLVKTSEDFGVQGDRPSHPKLLDWLATEFVRTGWDVKRMHKLIVTSATYRQSSRATPELIERDPHNRLLTRGPRFRLSAQALRDQALAISGLLVNQMGGPGVKPYQPPKVWSDYSLGKIKYKRDQGDKLYRRSVYTFWRRSVAPTLFFDNPARQACAVRPSLTNTPLHALTMLNDVTFIEAARVLAEKVIKDGGEPSERIEKAFKMATAREPNERELATLLRSLDGLLEQYQTDPAGAKKLVEAGEAPHDESLDAVEVAAYASLMNAILNLDEVVTKG